MKKMKETLCTAAWALKLALKIDAKLLLLWSGILSLLSVLPAIALSYNKQSVSILSDYLLTGNGSFQDIVPSIVTLGVVLTAVGLSKRINSDFLYFIMYDSFYFGLEEYMMDTVGRIEMKTLMDKQYREQHYLCMSRCGSLSDFVSAGCMFLSKFIGLASLLVVAANTSPVIFLLSAAYIAAVIILNFATADKIRWENRVFMEASRLSDYYQNSVMSPGVAKELRVYDLAKETEQKWEKAYQKSEDIDRHFVKVRRGVQFLSSVIFYLFIVLMLSYCIFRVSKGSMSVDVFLMLYTMGTNISELSAVFSRSFQSMDNGLYFLTRQRKFFESVPKDEPTFSEGFEKKDEENVFTAKDLCFSYDDKNEVLHDLSFSIKKGETVALVGLNGSGKTTLVKLLIGLFLPTKGSLCFYGNSYDQKTRGALIHRIGMFFQDFHIFHATLRENVGFGDVKSMEDTAKIRLAMEKGGATELEKKIPGGLKGWLLRDIKKDGTMLSGGEKQRIAVSRAHMSDKEVLIFDEPAAALDPIAEMRQFLAIKEKINGRTAILISHRVGFARLADRILVLNHGRLAESGTHEELMAANGIYANFYNEQASWYEKEGTENE